MKKPIAIFALTASLAGLAVACNEKQTGLYPVGSDETSPLQEERFVKRLYLDLSGLQPSKEELAAAVAALSREDDSPEARAALADDLIARPSFAKNWIAELENDAFAGTSIMDLYITFCPAFQDTDPACASCDLTAEEPCKCDCEPLEALDAERKSLLAASDDLAAGASTGSIARRYASSQVFQVNEGSPESIASGLFQTFLGRPAEADEVKNVRAMVFGDSVQGMGGLMFHHIGKDYRGLVGIVFASEVYRDAAVDRVFQRYLGRAPTPVELAHFSASLDANDPDVRGVIRAVVSSSEYFTQ